MTISSLRKSVPQNLPKAKLFLDDIREICDIMTNLSEPKDEWQLRFVAGEKVCDTWEDLKEIGGRTSDFSLKVSAPHRSRELEISRYDTRCYVFEYSDPDNAVAWSIYGKIRAVCEKRRLGLAGRAGYLLTILLCLIVLGLLFSNHPKWRIFVEFPVSCFVGILIAQAITMPSVVVMDYSHKRTTLRRFLDEHWSQIVIGILCAGIGALIKAAIDRLFK